MVQQSPNLAWSTFGRYALLEKIGSGGMAEIYRAKTFGAAGFEKEFAIKLILPSLVDDTEFVEMFINEAKIAVSLYHANIVQVFDLGELDGQYYIAMEFVHGMDLLDILARCAELDIKIPLDVVLFITMEMLKGLDFAHRAKDSYGDDLNIIHRDVSPSNVMISYAGDCKLGDFGVAKAAIQRNLTESGTLKGKVGYMSPEQVVGEDIDARSDIFSAGIVFFEALSMSRLFVGNSDLDVMLRVRDAEVDDALAKAQPLPAQLEQILRTALSKHREERYQTAGEFYQALVDFCFQHRIKVTGSDLSNFMRRLFAEEIEEEKNRRRSDAKAAEELKAKARREQVAPPPEASEAAEAVAEPAAGQADEPAAESAEIAARQVGASTSEGEEEEVPRETVENEAGESRYRYREDSGLIYGPMDFETLVQLVQDRDPAPGDDISVDGGEWVDPLDVDELAPYLPEEFAESAAGSVPVGAGVYRPKGKRSDEVGAEETVRDESSPREVREASVRAVQAAASALEEISMASGRSEAVGDDDAERDLGDGSSPVMSAAPEAVGPNTAEEAEHVIRELREQYASYEGDFEQVSVARLLARLHRSESTGRLHVEHGDIEKSIYFEDGEPILVDSNKEEELLGYFLCERGVITQEQLDEGLARLSEWGGRLGDALVAIGAIPAHEIFQHLSDQMREKLLEVFTWRQGTYGYFENQQPEMHGYPLGLDTYSTITDGCLKRMPVERIRRFYENRETTAMFRRNDPPVTVDDLRLTSKALRVVKQYEPGDTIRTLVGRLSDEDDDFLYRVIYLLHQVELFTFEETESQNLPGEDPG